MARTSPADRTVVAHELLDAGQGRRLDRFGSIVVDRPFPGVERLQKRDPAAWRAADARFERAAEGPLVHAGWTTADGEPIEPWTIDAEGLTIELRLAASGQVGFFPEQGANRAWLRERIGGAADIPPTILNLFAYTGASTLIAASAGGAVTHVDGARPNVAWARRNAELNGLAERPIRWIADDAPAFAAREARRGRRYTGIVLDPPSYGHGPGGREWRLERDLPGLLATSAALLEDGPRAFLILTAHSTGLESDELEGWLADALSASRDGAVEVEPMTLSAASGAWLSLGWSARWAAASA